MIALPLPVLMTFQLAIWATRSIFSALSLPVRVGLEVSRSSFIPYFDELLRGGVAQAELSPTARTIISFVTVQENSVTTALDTPNPLASAMTTPSIVVSYVTVPNTAISYVTIYAGLAEPTSTPSSILQAAALSSTNTMSQQSPADDGVKSTTPPTPPLKAHLPSTTADDIPPTDVSSPPSAIEGQTMVTTVTPSVTLITIIAPPVTRTMTIVAADAQAAVNYHNKKVGNSATSSSWTVSRSAGADHQGDGDRGGNEGQNRRR